MSFVTKRERVFKDDIDLYDLPPRNEGKLKAYSSCTDARAWSHFYSDQTEHLVDIIKRNNTSCAPKYVPTNVIVDTIMTQKNCEISRLRRKIDMMDQMLAVYDQLELDCGQKCEIAKAHESIKAASKELDDVCLDLDLTGFTEGLESDVYETGKSRGDDIEKSRGDMSVYSRVILPPMETKGVQNTQETVDMAIVVKDPRIEEMRDEIIFKDAKLNAMQNSMAVMENDVCEPYCVYAHIYTALEKIFGILYQNNTYKQYLQLLSAGKDTRCLDIKGRILFKMKILEKFALALMAPCSHKFANEAEKENKDCDCSGTTNIVARVETAYALTSSEAKPSTTSDSIRAHLVAEIMDSEEMKEILERDPYASDGLDSSNPYCGLTCYSIDAENVKRLKDLQRSYDELMECFENLKHEQDCLQIRCRKYNELEMEVETLRDQLASCNALWSEKEHFRKRSADLEDVNEKYLILQNVTGNLESEIKVEKEISNNKTQLIEDLRNENLILERKLSDAIITFEREKSALLCKLKEFECALSCKDQEVQSLAEQFQKHFDDNQGRDSIKTFSLINEIESLREELLNTKNLLDCCEDEKQHIKEEFQDKLSLINDLRMDFEDLKGNYENLLTKNIYTEEENERLQDEVDNKSKAINNLMEILSEKSKEINNLFDELETKKQENKQLMSELFDIQNQHDLSKEKFENERKQAQELLESEQRKSKELEDALTSDNQLEMLRNANLQRKSESHSSDYDSLRNLLEELRRGNALTEEKIMNKECCPVDFSQELKRLRNDFFEANEIIKILKNDKKECEMSHKRLVEELHNCKQKFADLEKDNINVVAELNNWKQKYRELDRESSNYYEESESIPLTQYQGSNENNKRQSTSFDKTTSQFQSNRVESNLGKQEGVSKQSCFDITSNLPRSQRSSFQHETIVMQNIPMSEIKSPEHKIVSDDKNFKQSSIIDQEATESITGTQEKIRLLSFDDIDLNRVNEYPEQVQTSDEKTRNQYLDMRQENDSKRSSIIDQGTTKRITGSQEKTRLLSFDDNDLNRIDEYREQVHLISSDDKTKNRYSDLLDQEALQNVLRLSKEMQNIPLSEVKSSEIKTITKQENDSKRSSIIDQGATKRITGSQEKTRLLSFDDNDLNRVDEYREEDQLISSDEKTENRYSDLLDQEPLQNEFGLPKEMQNIPLSEVKSSESKKKTRQENDSKRSSIIDRGAIKRHIGSQENTRLSFDENDLNRVGAFREQVPLMNSDEKTRPRYSELRDQILNVENGLQRDYVIPKRASIKESTIDIPEFKTTAERLSYEITASHDDSELQDLAKDNAFKPVLKNSEQEQLLGTSKNISQRNSDSKMQSKIISDHKELFYDESEQQNPAQTFNNDDSTSQTRSTYYGQNQLSSFMRVNNNKKQPVKLSSFDQELAKSKYLYEQNRLLSADEKTMHLNLDLNDRPQLQNLEVKLSVLDLEPQERALLISTSKSSLDSDHQENTKYLDDDTSIHSSKGQDRTHIFSAYKQAFNRDSNLQEHSLLPNYIDKTHQYDSKFQESARRSSADEKNPPLELGIQMTGEFLDLGFNISSHHSEVDEKTRELSVSYKPTSHDLRPLEQAQSSSADEKYKDSQYQEKNPFSNIEKADTSSILQHENNFEKHDNQRHSIKSNSYNALINQGVITGEKHSVQTHRDASKEIKLVIDDKPYINEVPWKQQRDSDYSSKVKYQRRLSFGKAEAEESLNKRRRYSDIQYDNIDITDQQKRDLEEQYDWKQKFEESEREKHNKLLTLQEKEKELNYWKEKYCALDKTKIDEQENIKNFLDKVIEEKKQLEEILSNKKDELDVLKENNQLNLERALQSELLEEELKKRRHLYEMMLEEKQLIQKQLLDTQKQMEDLVLSLEQEKSQLVTQSKLIPDMEDKLQEFQNAFDDSLNKIQSLENQLKKKEEELLEMVKENSALKDELLKLRLNQTKLQAASEENLLKLQSEKDEIQQILEAMEKENNKLIVELEEYQVLTKHLDNIKGDYDDLKRENRNLQDKLVHLEEKNYDYIKTLEADNRALEAMLLEAKEQMIRGLESPERSLYPTNEEITAMRQEQQKNHATIRELKDIQDENENIISDLKGDIMTRDERIAILENHINMLTNEVENLHGKLEDGISAREELQGQTLQGYDESLKKIEARHSKASHNMRTEIAQLEKEKAVLQEQLSKTRNQNEESLRDKDAYYLSKIADLTNEREIMITELKKLENITNENLGFTTDNVSNIQSVRESFSRISSSFEANKSQSAALENKLYVVKRSSEELLSKTYEAKRIAENEKQKIFLEKEEAVKERLNLEMKMRDLTKTFEEKRDDDRTTIDNLNKQVLNQQLIIKAMNESTEEHTQKLNEKINALQNLYDNSLIKINELEKQLKDSNRENGETIKTLTTQNKAIEKYSEMLERNSKEMSELQEALNAVRSISKEDVEIQTSKIETKDNITESLEELPVKKIKTRSQKQQNDVPELNSRTQDRIPEKHRNASKDIAKFNENMTELQIMNANVQPSLDFVKNTYRKHRQDQLSNGPVETHSILSFVEKDSDNQLTDIYSQPLLDKEEPQYSKTNINDQSKTTTAKTNQIINEAKKNKLSSGTSNDEDLFLIYSSSGTMHNEPTTFAIPDSSKSHNREDETSLKLTNKTDLEKGFDDSTHKNFANYDGKASFERKPTPVEKKIYGQVRVKKSTSDESFALPKKQALKVTTIGSNENAGKSSQSSYNGDVSQQMLLHSSDTDDDKLKRKETQSKSKLSLNEYKPESEDFFDNLSNDQDNHFKLSRSDKKSIKLKQINDNNKEVLPVTSKKQDFGLNFILETAKHEIQETFDYDTNSLLRSRSDEKFNKNTSRTIPENSFPAINRHQIVSHSVVVPLKEKKVADKEVSINSESTEKLEQLTAALDNCKKDYKKKLEAIKAQYDTNIKRMIIEHNEGVTNLQNIHEDIIKDMVKKHESEVDNLRTISFEAMRKVEVLEKDNKLLKNRLRHSGTDILDQEPVKIDSRFKVRDARLSKTTIESFDVKPRMRHSGPCSCSLDVNVSDTIRNIFEQVDQDQRKLAEVTYVKYIAHKMLSGNVDALDSQELAFLHFNVCRHWKVKQNMENTLRKKIDSLETELLSKQRHAQQHIAELDRRVAEERRRLQEVREAVGYQPVPGVSQSMQPDRDNCDVGCYCARRNIDAPVKIKKNKPESHCPERRLPRPQQPQNQPDETPTRMRRSIDKSARSNRK